MPSLLKILYIFAFLSVYRMLPWPGRGQGPTATRAPSSFSTLFRLCAVLLLLLQCNLRIIHARTKHAFLRPLSERRHSTRLGLLAGTTALSGKAVTDRQPPLPTTRSVPDHPVPQVLAPAGGREQFLAALNAGADQVFLGLKNFNARARAENFCVEDLKELVPMAHKFGMQVLVTVNVLIKEEELGALIDTLSALEELEVDAIIVQDQAVGALVREFFPTLRIHASTQMAVHNLQGVVKAAELGYQRVVLAREVTAKEMKDIRAGVPSGVAELEAFVHGSLCYSYSGLCFFSGETDARSGNRGECAYTCRQPYTLTSEDGMGFLFSMADLDTSHDLDLLAEAGIDTLKVEGRKKGEGARAHAGHWWTHLSL